MVVLDLEFVDKGIMEWSAKWRCYGLRCSTREVGHRDLQEQILYLREMGGAQV